jgi:hypothetical protein
LLASTPGVDHNRRQSLVELYLSRLARTRLQQAIIALQT